MPNPLGPVIYAIYVNEVLIKDFPLDTELRQAWGKHDMFFIRIEYPRTYSGLKTQKLWDDNAPVRIIWGRRPTNIETWYGYVNHHNVASNADSGSKALQITYVCIGTSKPMNTDRNRTWGQVTPTYIARKLAGEYGFRAVLTKTNWILPFETQANESDFAFLNRIAEKVGYRFWVSGGTLYMIDPAVVLITANNQAVPSFTLDKFFTQLDTVRDFDMNEGGNLPGATIAYRTIYGVDKNSGTVIQATASTKNSPTITQIKTDRVANSLNEAKNLVQAWESMNQWWISAKAELYGTVALYPGKLISLSGNQMPQDTQGYWVVTSATHVLSSSGSSLATADKYVSHVEILRNTTGVVPNLKQLTKINPEFVACRLDSSKQWKAKSATVLYDGVQSV